MRLHSMAIGALLVSMVMSCWDSCGNCGCQISWRQFTPTPDPKWKSGWLVTGKIHKHPSDSFSSCHPCRQCCLKLAAPMIYTARLAWCGHLHQLRRQARQVRARQARRLRIDANIRWHRYLVAFGLESNHPLVGCRLDMPSFLTSLAIGSSRKSHLSEGL